MNNVHSKFCSIFINYSFKSALQYNQCYVTTLFTDNFISFSYFRPTSLPSLYFILLFRSQLEQTVDIIRTASSAADITLGSDLYIVLDIGASDLYDPAKGKYELGQGMMRASSDLVCAWLTWKLFCPLHNYKYNLSLVLFSKIPIPLLSLFYRLNVFR